MATLAKADLLDAVSAKNDKTDEDFTTAQTSEIKEWALDCLRWLMPLAPEHAITSALHSVENAAEPYTIPSDCMKVVRVAHYTDGDLMREVDPGTFAKASATYSGGANSYKEGFRIWADIMGTVKCFRVGASDTINVDYVKEPQWGTPVFRKRDDGGTWRSYELLAAHTSGGTGDDSEPEDGTNWTVFWKEVTYDSSHTLWAGAGESYTFDDNVTVPVGWAGIVASYCAVQLKMKKEESAQAKLSWEVFLQELSKFRGFRDISLSVGG